MRIIFQPSKDDVLIGECKCGVVVEMITEDQLQSKVTAEKAGDKKAKTIQFSNCPKCGSGMYVKPVSESSAKAKRIWQMVQVIDGLKGAVK